MAWRAVQARSELYAARADLTQAKTALLDQRLDDADRAIAAAGVRTGRARRLTSDPVFTAAAHVPLAGRSLAVVQAIARSTDALAADVLPQAVRTADGLRADRLRRADGSVDVAALQQATPALHSIAARAAGLRRSIDTLPRSWLLSPVRRGRDEFAAQLATLADAASSASRAVDLAPALLGADRPRRYFLLLQQTSESRGTGGLPGGFAVLTADHGRLKVTAQGTDADLRNGPIPVPPGVGADYVDLYGPNGAFDLWQNVNLSPDLPTVARVIAARWRAQGGQQVDGVIATDALGLADVLRGSGPIDLGDRSLRPDQLPDYLAIGQYADFSPLDKQAARKGKLAIVARAALQRLTRGGGSSTQLLRGLIDAVRSGHLRIASDDPALHPRLAAAGVDGHLPTGPAPVAYPVVFNSSGGKLDYWLDRSVDYRAGPCTGLMRRSTITVRLRNGAPASGLPPYLTILTNSRLGQTESYDGAVTLSLFTTRGSEFAAATLDGRPISLAPMGGGPFLSTGTEQGLSVWYLFLDLPRTKTRTLVLQLDEPLAKGAARVPEQPLARPLRSHVAVPVCR